MVEVKLMAYTVFSEMLICRAARNDYYDGDVSVDDYTEIMNVVEGATEEEKDENLLHKLMLRGHWGHSSIHNSRSGFVALGLAWRRLLVIGSPASTFKANAT